MVSTASGIIPGATAQAREGWSLSARVNWLVQTPLHHFFDSTRNLILGDQRVGVFQSGDPKMLYYSIISITGTMFTFEPKKSLLDPGNQAQNTKEIEDLIHANLFQKLRMRIASI